MTRPLERSEIALLNELKKYATEHPEDYDEDYKVLKIRDEHKHKNFLSLFKDDFITTRVFRETNIDLIVLADEDGVPIFYDMNKLADYLRIATEVVKIEAQQNQTQSAFSGPTVRLRNTIPVCKPIEVRKEAGTIDRRHCLLVMDQTLTTAFYLEKITNFMRLSEIASWQVLEINFMYSKRGSTQIVPTILRETRFYEICLSFRFDAIRDRDGEIKDIRSKSTFNQILPGELVTKPPVEPKVIEILKRRPELAGLVLEGVYIPIVFSNDAIRRRTGMTCVSILKERDKLLQRIVPNHPTMMPIEIPIFLFPKKVYLHAESMLRYIRELQTDQIRTKTGVFQRKTFFAPVFTQSDKRLMDSSIPTHWPHITYIDEFLLNDPEYLKDVRYLTNEQRWVTLEELQVNGIHETEVLDATNLMLIKNRIIELRDHKITFREIIDYIHSDRWKGEREDLHTFVNQMNDVLTIIALSRVYKAKGRDFTKADFAKANPQFGTLDQNTFLEEGQNLRLLEDRGNETFRIVRLEKLHVEETEEVRVVEEPKLDLAQIEQETDNE